MELGQYRITEGSGYGWQCYGPDAYALDSWNGEQDGFSFSVIFDTKTQTVYEVQAHDYVHDRAYRMINPDFKQQFDQESRQRGQLGNQAWDDVDYVDLEVDDDFIQKSLSIQAGEDYDTRVTVPVDFTDDELLKYMKMAHEHDMTFNAFVELALREAIDQHHMLNDVAFPLEKKNKKKKLKKLKKQN